MRTTIRIDDRLLAEAKQHAARTGRTLTAVIEDALRETLARQRTTVTREPVRITTVSGAGLREGVNLDHTADLWELIDRPDGPG